MGTDRPRRKAAAIAQFMVLAVAGAALASCSPAVSQAVPAPETSAPVSSPAATVTRSPSPTPSPTMTRTNVGKGLEPFGHFLVTAGRSEGQTWVHRKADFHVIGKGPVTIEAEALLPGKEITVAYFTSTGTEAKPLIGAVIEYRAPASGLDPEKYVTVLMAIDPATGSVLKQTEVLREDRSGGVKTFAGSSDSTAVAFSVDGFYMSDGVTRTTAYDVMTGERLWQRDGYSRANVFGALTLEVDGRGMNSGGEPCPRAVGVDIATGKDLFSVDHADVVPESICHNVSVGASDLMYTHVGVSSGSPAFNSRTGAPVTLPDDLLAADPRSSLVVGSPNAAYQADVPFIVTDAATGEVKYTLDAVTAGKLRATVDALYDGKLYLKTSDQHPVVDVATGKTITDNATEYPVGAVDSWTYWSDGRLEKTP